LSFIHGFI